MPIDPDTYRAPAIRGDITGIAISTSIALNRIANALDTLASLAAASDVDREQYLKSITADIAKIRSEATDIEKHFDRLSGWTSEQ